MMRCCRHGDRGTCNLSLLEQFLKARGKGSRDAKIFASKISRLLQCKIYGYFVAPILGALSLTGLTDASFLNCNCGTTSNASCQTVADLEPFLLNMPLGRSASIDHVLVFEENMHGKCTCRYTALCTQYFQTQDRPHQCHRV